MPLYYILHIPSTVGMIAISLILYLIGVWIPTGQAKMRGLRDMVEVHRMQAELRRERAEQEREYRERHWG